MELDKDATKKFGLKVLRREKSEDKTSQNQGKKKKQDFSQDSEAGAFGSQSRDEE